MDFQADEEESEEDDQNKKDGNNTKENTEDTNKKEVQSHESPRRARRTHSLFACGGKKARGVAIVVNARHTKDA